MLAAITALEVTQTVWSGPAAEMEGTAFVVIVTFETEEAQGGLLIDHVKTVNPGVKPVSAVFLRRGFARVPEPETITHIPVPLTGALPAKLVEAVPVVAQRTWLGPAFETVGAGFVVIVMFEIEGTQDEKLVVHASTVVPTVSPVTVEAGFVGVVIVPGPEIFVHTPEPTTGVLPAKRAVPAVTQTV